MKKLTIPFLIIIGLVLAGCNFPGFDVDIDEDPDDAMATEIAKILTGTPDDIEVTPTPVDEDIDPEIPDPTPTEPEEIEEPEPSTPTPEPTDTPTPMPTPTLTDTDPAKSLGTPNRIDNLDSSSGWVTGTDKFTRVTFEDGYMKLTSLSSLAGWRVHWPVLADFYLEFSFVIPKCETNDFYGMMFRVPADSQTKQGYLFGISCNGRYNLRRWNDPNMITLINWTSSDLINTGNDTNNKIGILANGGSLTLYINGQKVNQITDNTFLEGKYGPFIGGNTLDDFTIWVDQIRYWVNP